MPNYLLFESAAGYALFERVKSEEIAITTDEIQQSLVDLARFSKIVKLKAFLPFTSAENSLENMNKISEGELTQNLVNFLEMNLPKGSSKSTKASDDSDSKESKKASKVRLGVVDPKIGNSISDTMGIKCESNEVILELLRGIRFHFTNFLKALKPTELIQAELGLGHAYSRSKVKFNVNRVDNMIIQSICLLDQLDKDLNTFSMRVREWYSWHFPELVRIVNDNAMYCKLAVLIKDKSKLTAEAVPQMTEITGDATKAQEILDAARMSMGTDISSIDLGNIEQFATRVASLANYRKELSEYLTKKMNDCAPNLSALIGEVVGARLISHAGSLTSLAKYPASTVQILGAEKALFRSLKNKGNTPKYGLIFHSSFIGKATPKNKGRIARYLANKCSIASRIDSFSESSTDQYGVSLRQQVEDRLEFYKSGKKPAKNSEVMKKAAQQADETEKKEEASKGKSNDMEIEKKEEKKEEEKSDKKSKKSKKRKAEEPSEVLEKKDAEEAKKEVAAKEESKKEKKEKKKKEKESKKTEEVATTPAEPEKKKKHKKDKSQASS
eukprot:TRINITY_DN813_c0_g3_i1.p1 TRINITY_DN813_c0_g3~~TRINITY_DN813_c0_g3_i1.p1  ORF type:complete len:556 (-),score=182.79 TRINITY_DN813_c0_g3_i1:344-2011(-)